MYLSFILKNYTNAFSVRNVKNNPYHRSPLPGGKAMPLQQPQQWIRGLQDLVQKEGRIVRMGLQPAFYASGGFRRIMSGEDGDDPVLGEENIAGPLDFLHFIKAGDQIIQRFFLA